MHAINATATMVLNAEELQALQIHERQGSIADAGEAIDGVYTLKARVKSCPPRPYERVMTTAGALREPYPPVPAEHVLTALGKPRRWWSPEGREYIVLFSNVVIPPAGGVWLIGFYVGILTY